MRKKRKLFFMIIIAITLMLVGGLYVFAAQDLGDTDCGHWQWEYLQDSGQLSINICSPDKNFGSAVLTVKGLNGKQFYYTNYPDTVFLSLSGNPCGLKLKSDRSSIFTYTFCSDCGSPYLQEFSALFDWQMPAYYEFDTVTHATSGGTITLDSFKAQRDYVWKGFHFTNWIPSGTTTLKNNSFTLNASTYLDLGISTDTPSGITTNGPGSVTIFLRKQSFNLSVNSNGGIWEGKKGISVCSQQWGTNRVISNPTPPSGTNVICNPNGGVGGGTINAQKVFDGWTKQGSGSLVNGVFTFGTGDTLLTANYRNQSIKLPSATRKGYKFLGWYTSASAGTKVGDIGSNWIPSQTEIFAHWEPITYFIEYIGNGSSDGNMSKSKFVYDIPSKLSKNKFIRNGCEFVGWNTNPSASKALYLDEALVKNLAETDGTVIKLYAIWKKDITLTYDATGGLNNPQREHKVVYNTNTAEFIISNKIPERKGYEFLGWSTDKNAEEGSYHAGDKLYISHDTTLYAIWYPILNVTASVERTLSPHSPVFQAGEQGKLTIKVYGYAEKVIVTFPPDITELDDDVFKNDWNQEYNLAPALQDGIEQEFFIPLNALEKEYTIEVSAFKNGRNGPEEKKAYPIFYVTGSILDDMRTRLR